MTTIVPATTAQGFAMSRKEIHPMRSGPLQKLFHKSERQARKALPIGSRAGRMKRAKFDVEERVENWFFKRSDGTQDWAAAGLRIAWNFHPVIDNCSG